MGVEVERKFLVRGEGWREDATDSLRLRQFYLMIGHERSTRVRIREDHEAILTLKFGGSARRRHEFEYEIPVADAAELEAFALGDVVSKTRHLVPHGPNVWEVDVFEQALSGLVTAELETNLAIPPELMPSWLGREVTGEPAYYNATLALRGLPAGAQ